MKSLQDFLLLFFFSPHFKPYQEKTVCQISLSLSAETNENSFGVDISPNIVPKLLNSLAYIRLIYIKSVK